MAPAIRQEPLNYLDLNCQLNRAINLDPASKELVRFSDRYLSQIQQRQPARDQRATGDLLGKRKLERSEK
jgi:hypothetical protein